MITKKELLEKIYAIGNSKGVEFLEWVNSLPDDEPTTIPFKYPVPDGYEVVIDAPDSDPRKVVRDIQEPDELGESACKVDGKWMVLDTSDLFLRRVEKKVWVVEWNGGMWAVDTKKPDLSPPNSNIYEATLKPVV